MENRHLIVVSVDAMVYEDLELLSRLPNVGKLMREGSLVRRVRSIYPALTHPIHAALMSGCAANATGIPNNETFVPGQLHAPWYNRLEQMRCDTIFHAAHRAGLTTCACRWPVTAGGFDVIDYLVPEVLDDDQAAEPDPEALYRKVCSPVLFEDVVRPNLPKLAGPQHPGYEIFANACACDILRKFRPNLLFTHPGTVDAARHENGLFGPAVDEALRMTDEWIGQLMAAAADAGIADRTSFAIVSDHGHLEIRRDIALNAFLRERGFLQVDAAGRVTDWVAWAKSCDLSAQIYVKDPARVDEVGAALREMCDAGIYGISEVMTTAEAEARFGLSGDFAFVVESDGFTRLSDGWSRPAVQLIEPDEYRRGHSTHGHRPDKGPQPPMIVWGPAFRSGVALETGSILDEAPTFAAAMGLTLPEAQGRPIDALLR